MISFKKKISSSPYGPFEIQAVSSPYWRFPLCWLWDPDFSVPGKTQSLVYLLDSTWMPSIIWSGCPVAICLPLKPKMMSSALEMLWIPPEASVLSSLSQLHSLRNSRCHPVIMYAFIHEWVSDSVWGISLSELSPLHSTPSPSFVGHMSVHKIKCHFRLGGSRVCYVYFLMWLLGPDHIITPP